MEQFLHDGAAFELNSLYLLHDDAWTYELTGPHGTDSRFANLSVLIPDATPDDGAFEPMDAAHVRVLMEDGVLPWTVLMWFVGRVEDSGDVRTGVAEATVTGDLRLSNNTWRFADRTFEVNSFHSSDRDCWCYELYEVDPANEANNYVHVRIPDRNPDGGPFRPVPSAEVTVGIHGSFDLPWLVLRHFLRAVADSGDIVDAPPLPGARPPIGRAARAEAWRRFVVPPATNPPPPNHGTGAAELVLVAPGPRPIELIKKIREITGFGLMDARALLATCPSLVITGLSEAHAADLQHALTEAGATVDIRSP